MSDALDSALALPIAERLALLEAVWNSIVDEGGTGLPVTDAERRELDRRLEAHRADPAGGDDWATVRARLAR